MSEITVIVDPAGDTDGWLPILDLLKHPRVGFLGITAAGVGAACITSGARARKTTISPADGVL